MNKNLAGLLLAAVVASGCGGSGSRESGSAAIEIERQTSLAGLTPSSQPMLLIQKPEADFEARFAKISDINGDSRADLVLVRTGNGSGKLSLFLGGTSYRAMPDFETEVDPTVSALLLADVTGEGRSDVLLGTESGVQLLPGNADGTLGAAVAAYDGGAVTALCAGDFEGDRMKELALVSSSGVLILRGSEAGFESASPVAGQAVAVAAFDFNQDGRDELAVLGASDVRIYEGSELRATLALPAGYQGRDFVAADLDGNGTGDLAAVSSFDETGLLCVWSGAGFDFALTTYPTDGAPLRIAATDFDGDGRTDLVRYEVDPDESGRMIVALGTEQDGFADGGASLAVGPLSDLSAADVTSDGRGDLLVAAGVFFVVEGASSPFAPAMTLGVAPSRVAIGDVNGDGRLDLVGAGMDGDLAVLLGNDAGGFLEPEIFGIAGEGEISALLTVDVAGSGTAGVLVERGRFLFLFSYATGAWTQVGPGMSPRAADVNQDGIQEAVAVDPTSGTPIVRSLVTVYEEYWSGESSGAAYDLALVDLDNDGDLDAVVLDAAGCASYRNENGSFAPAYSIAAAGSYRLLAGDFAGDGADEAILVDTVDPAASRLLRGMSLEQEPRVLGFVPEIAIDLNGDGRTDLAGSSSSTPGMVLWSLGNGEGFDTARGALAHPVAASIAAGDFDGDGGMDLAAGSGWMEGLDTPGGLSVVRLIRQ